MTDLIPPRTSPFSTPGTKAQSDFSAILDGVVERKCQLTVLSGDHDGKVVEIGKSPFLVGKAEGADLILSDATVSRDHFVIEQADGAFVIRDKGSTNGTWIDQFRIREAYLRPGTIVRAGEVQIRFEPLFSKIDVAPSTNERFGALVGQSTRMRQIFTLLDRVAKTEATVILLGETGSGKSAVARAIHEESSRASGPFVTIDCGAIAENLIESELFGHEKGAFTGATSSRQGALERAQKGTLFIDELVDLPVHLQPRLLRVLEEREVRRVGANDTLKLDVRVIAASRKDLWREVEEGRFREDLYFRLAVFTIPLPPLRERPEDIPLLAMAFARSLPNGEKILARGGFHRLASYPFYGNVRELRNVVERASYLDGDIEDLLSSMMGPETTSPGRMVGPPRTPPGGTNVGAPISGMGPPAYIAQAAPPSHANAHLPPNSPVQPTATPIEFTRAESSGGGWSVGALGDIGAGAGPDDAVSLSADCTKPFKEAKEALLEQFEGEYLKRLIARESGSAAGMARSAGIDRKYLYTLAKKHDVSLKGD